MFKSLSSLGLCVALGLTASVAYAANPPAVSAQAQQQRLLIDVRTPNEYAQGHLKGAKNMPHYDIAQLIEHAKISKNTPIDVYCRSGRRSEIALQTLKKMGYQNVRNLGAYESLRSKQ